MTTEEKTPNKFVSSILPVDLRLGQLVTLTALPKQGATTIALSLAKEFEESQPLYISTQVSTDTLIEQWQEKNHKFPDVLTLGETAINVNTKDIKEFCSFINKNHKTKIIIIDNLSGINDFGKNNEYAKEAHPHRITSVMKDLREIAREFNVIMFVVVPISLTDGRRSWAKVEDLRYSSGILENADIALLAHREGIITSNSDELMYEINVGASRIGHAHIGTLSKYNAETGFLNKSTAQQIKPDTIW